MGNKGGNKGTNKGQSEDVLNQNKKDREVARDPDIAGVNRRSSNDVHKRDRSL